MVIRVNHSLEVRSSGALNRRLLPLATSTTSNLYRHSLPLATSHNSHNQPSHSPHPLTSQSFDSLNQKMRKQPLNPHPTRNLLLRITLLIVVPTLKFTFRPLNIWRKMILILTLYPTFLTTVVLLLPHHRLLVDLNYPIFLRLWWNNHKVYHHHLFSL